MEFLDPKLIDIEKPDARIRQLGTGGGNGQAD
jgi:hypothetical protein